MTDGAGLKADIRYVTRGDEPPRIYYDAEPPAGEPRSTLVIDQQEVALFDVRGKEETFSLDRDGVAFPTREMDFTDFDDDAAVESELFPIMEQFARELTGAQIVKSHPSGYATRRRSYGFGYEDRPTGKKLRIGDFAHGDFTDVSGAMKKWSPSDDEDGSDERFVILNFWSPIRGPLYDYPLGLCDINTVADDDLIGIDNVFAGVTSVVSGLAYSPKHRWLFKSAMMPGDFLVFRTWDSNGRLEDNVHHVAFIDRTAPEGCLPRESFEYRVSCLLEG